ncbi:hypothetical protein GOODEAATRI_027410, partial [Goodea atripinnis]
DKPLQRKQQVVKPGNHRNLYSRQLSRMPPTRTPGIEVPLALSLTDSLLLCVLQEPLEDPSVSHIEALHSRLEAVAHTLEKVNFGSEVILEEVGQGTRLSDKLNLLCAYLEQRIGSLQALVQVQTDFESSVKDLLQGLDGLWTQLEELHAGVTLTKKDSQGNKDLASAQADAEVGRSDCISAGMQTHFLFVFSVLLFLIFSLFVQVLGFSVGSVSEQTAVLSGSSEGQHAALTGETFLPTQQIFDISCSHF